jgi:hypothetical protein
MQNEFNPRGKIRHQIQIHRTKTSTRSQIYKLQLLSDHITSSRSHKIVKQKQNKKHQKHVIMLKKKYS